MSIFEPASPRAISRMLSILRIVSGLIFITAGTMKLFGFPKMTAPNPMPPLVAFSQIWFGGVLEVFGGAAFTLGLLTRPVSFILAGEMAVAYFQFHYPNSFFPTVNMGIPAVLYCFIFLYFVVSGAGEWSVDEMISRSKRGNAR